MDGRVGSHRQADHQGQQQRQPDEPTRHCQSRHNLRTDRFSGNDGDAQVAPDQGTDPIPVPLGPREVQAQSGTHGCCSFRVRVGAQNDLGDVTGKQAEQGEDDQGCDQ